MHNNGYIKLDPMQALGSQLVSMKIIEYPTILVVSSTSNSADFVIIEDRSVNGALLSKDTIPEGFPTRKKKLKRERLLNRGDELKYYLGGHECIHIEGNC